MALAYPGTSYTHLGEEIARDHFITALADRDLELKVRDRDLATLDEAFRVAVRAETHLRVYEGERGPPRGAGGRGDRYDERRARQVVGAAIPVDTIGGAGDAVTRQLNAQLERCQRERDELSKELGRLKVLNDPFEGRNTVSSKPSFAPYAGTNRGPAQNGVPRIGLLRRTIGCVFPVISRDIWLVTAR